MIALNDGNKIPPIGLGTYPLNAAQVLSGLEAGYRLLDSALKYGNEHEVGAAVRRSGIDRAEIQVTTKLPGRFHGFDRSTRSSYIPISPNRRSGPTTRPEAS